MWVLAGIAAGIVTGQLAPDFAVRLQPLGTTFVDAIKMVVAPIVFRTVVGGIAQVDNLRKVGRVGLKSIVYFEAVTSVALLLGLVVMNVFRPGDGVHADPAGLAVNDTVGGYIKQGRSEGWGHYLSDIVPGSVVGAFADGDILQVLFFAVLFGAMAFTIGKYGVDTLTSLGKLIGVFYGISVFFFLAILGSIAAALGINIFRLLRYIREELLIVLGISSSEPVLPQLMRKLEALGAPRQVVGLTVPTGYSFNLDGACIYLTLSALYLAQAVDVDLSIGQQLAIVGVLLLTSKGAAGVTGSEFIVLAATLSTVDTIPVAAIMLIFGIDKFMSECRALTNVCGNTLATLVVARWEGVLDTERLQQVLAHGPTEPPTLVERPRAVAGSQEAGRPSGDPDGAELTDAVEPASA
ncbi:cation:dicarboxylate symporter family transporter [Frankia tisae]|uniref:cation:dicarboxylate symporter family transporter n=1 Tax=Frankia tisae TaxID=2950104 RepID=UPI0021C17ED3|nr:cation:dicarboxylase symporter family transporter [Frankia tisae]